VEFRTVVRDTLYLHECNVSPQIGTDIGGAIPIPFGSQKINAFPRLSPSIGVSFGYTYQYRWNLCVELTYKRIAMDADARVSNQKFKGEGMVQFFTGTAEMNMSFTLIEIPLYVKYMFGANRQHGAAIGGYFAKNLKTTFVSTAVKGFTGPLSDVVESTISAPMVMDFSSTLDTWDAGIMLGYSSRVYNSVNMGVNFLIGCKDIFTPGSDFFDYKMVPIRGSITLNYNLFRFGKQRIYPKRR
jgi:hypothetical protein